MTIDVNALRAAPGCGFVVWKGSVQVNRITHERAYHYPTCDNCLSLLAAAAIRAAVERLPISRDGNGNEYPRFVLVEGCEHKRESLLAALLPTQEGPTP